MINTEKNPREYARFVEFGTATTPSRSFIRAPFDADKSGIYLKLKSALRNGITRIARSDRNG